MKTVLKTDKATQPAGSYSQGVIANGFLFSAGFGPIDPVTGVVPEGIVAQTHLVLQNIEEILAVAGLDLSDVVKVTAHLSDLTSDFAAYNAVFSERMPAPYPVRTTVGSDLGRILVEIDVIAALREV